MEERQDLISRQTAIDVIEVHKNAIMKMYGNLMPDKNTRERGIVDGMDYALVDLRDNVPSAQPDHSGDVNGKVELIDIQAAIDVLMDEFKRVPTNAIRAKDALEKLPSAQPEIIRCKDCKYGEQDDIGRWFCNDLGCQIGSEDGSGYCANAERRTDD